ncbi:hypothetical protein [Chelativorans xinjiangense]|uniref:hypothetical protein n=1 Tax=Chelativorans xinjiangense TaxID=2681485 RepID=UPI00135855DC|nr:hypothetical protein [Chelativorans xinjiangense]
MNQIFGHGTEAGCIHVTRDNPVACVRYTPGRPEYLADRHDDEVIIGALPLDRI